MVFITKATATIMHVFLSILSSPINDSVGKGRASFNRMGPERTFLSTVQPAYPFKAVWLLGNILAK